MQKGSRKIIKVPKIKFMTAISASRYMAKEKKNYHVYYAIIYREKFLPAGRAHKEIFKKQHIGKGKTFKLPSKYHPENKYCSFSWVPSIETKPVIVSRWQQESEDSDFTVRRLPQDIIFPHDEVHSFEIC